MYPNGTKAERQMKFLLIEDMGFKNEIPEDWTTESLLTLLQEEAPNHLPRIMKDKSWSLFKKQSPHYILDRGYKVDFLIHSGKVGGYLGINFMLYPRDKGWSKYLVSSQGIIDLYEKGIYNALNIKRMGIFLVEPGTPHCIVDEELKEAQEDKVFEFLDTMEKFEGFLCPTGILDLREDWECLELPPQ